VTYGFVLGELIRRIDGRLPSTTFRDELKKPTSTDFHMGLSSVFQLILGMAELHRHRLQTELPSQPNCWAAAASARRTPRHARSGHGGTHQPRSPECSASGNARLDRPPLQHFRDERATGRAAGIFRQPSSPRPARNRSMTRTST
jgi:hypothetical protein